jgi:murein DD-endopeptidase MepM/ murein hydrolase activator NlpD
MGYQRPCDAPISGGNEDPRVGTYRAHREGIHRPRSREAGVDYACAQGTPLHAPADGVVHAVKDTNSDATGRFLTLDLDDGRRVRWLHLKAQHFPAPGTRFQRGQVLAHSGGSASGSDTGVGSHVHVTLWPTHVSVFGLDADTLDFEAHVDGGGGSPSPLQRVVGPNGANGRRDPSTANPVAQTLAPGTVANLDGFITGQDVQGNAVWFHGQINGNWFWSGGFTDPGTHDLPSMNPVQVQVGAQQRKVGPNGANGRGDPSTNDPVLQTLAPGTIGDFNGFIRGQAVQGNDVWFRGAHSGNWFWSGGFDTADTHGLTDLNTPTPAPAPAALGGGSRTVAANPANVRDLPFTSSPVVRSEPPGTVISVKGFATAEKVSGIDTWFQRADGEWMWAGGFTETSTADIPRLETPDPPAAFDPDNPRRLVLYTPVCTHAFRGLDAPLGFNDDGLDALRVSKGLNPPVPVIPIIDRYIIHHTGTTEDQLDFFSHKNDRSSCPTWYLRADGSVIEVIRPRRKPAATGSEWNWRSVATETLNNTGEPEWKITDAQKEAHAQIIAWLAGFDGAELDGVPVSFRIDREHVITHQETGAATECPGPDLQGSVDGIVARAREIFEQQPNP